jgi:hypothetical protein
MRKFFLVVGLLGLVGALPEAAAAVVYDEDQAGDLPHFHHPHTDTESWQEPSVPTAFTVDLKPGLNTIRGVGGSREGPFRGQGVTITSTTFGPDNDTIGLRVPEGYAISRLRLNLSRTSDGTGRTFVSFGFREHPSGPGSGYTYGYWRQLPAKQGPVADSTPLSIQGYTTFISGLMFSSVPGRYPESFLIDYEVEFLVEDAANVTPVPVPPAAGLLAIALAALVAARRLA